MKISEFRKYLVSLFSDTGDIEDADDVIAFVCENIDYTDIDFNNPDAEISIADALLFTYWFGLLVGLSHPEQVIHILQHLCKENLYEVN